MKIKTRLYFSATISIVTAGILFFLLYGFHQNLNEELEKFAVANDLVKKTTDLIVITNEYLIDQSKRSESQWYLHYKSIIEIVKNNEKVVYREIITKDLMNLKNYFARIKSEYRIKNKKNISEKELEKIIVAEQVLSGQMQLSSQKILSTVFEFASITENKIRTVESKSNYIILVFTVFFIVLILINSLITAKMITQPLKLLVEGAHIIEKGDFNYQIDNYFPESVIRKKDEIHELISAFNSMSYQLNMFFENFKKEESERKQVEKELNESLNKNRAIIDAIPDMMFILSRDGVYLDIFIDDENQLAIPRDEIIGKNIRDINLSRKSLDAILSKIDIVLQTGRIEQYEYELITPAGAGYFELRIVLLTDNTVLSVVRDVTDKKKAEEEIDSWMRRYEFLIASSGQIAYEYNSKNNIILWGGSITSTLGYSHEEMGTKIEEWSERIHPDDRFETLRLLDISEKEMVPYKIEYRFKHQNGEYRWISENGSFIPDETGKSNFMLGMMHDITERKKTEAQLLQAQKMETVGTLAGGLAHDFNNILGGILGSESLLERLLGKEKLLKKEKIFLYLDTIKRSSVRASEMIKQLLILSRKNEISLIPVDVNLAIENVIKICVNSFPKSIELETELPGKHATIKGDPTQIEQVILNLCVNASHAMTIMKGSGEKEGGKLFITIDNIISDESFCTSHPDAEKGLNYHVIKVSDNGVGMDSEMLSRVFEPFFTTKKLEKGSGLGLSMVYNLIRQHEGFISIYSEKGKGSVFNVYLPEFIEEKSLKNVSEAYQGSLMGNGCILVVDDEEIMRVVARGALEESGYDVMVARDGEESINIFRNNYDKITAVLLDMCMPNMSGKETYQELIKFDPGVKVLLTSGFRQDENVQKTIDLGVNGFIQKPYTDQSLIEKLKEIIENK